MVPPQFLYFDLTLIFLFFFPPFYSCSIVPYFYSALILRPFAILCLLTGEQSLKFNYKKIDDLFIEVSFIYCFIYQHDLIT
jgi:hypothetical protein